MLLTKIDVTVVGDLLQSLEHLENCMNICDKTSGIIINKDDYINQFTPSDSEITNYYNNNDNHSHLRVMTNF